MMSILFLLTIQVIQLHELHPNPCMLWLVMLSERDPVMIQKWPVRLLTQQSFKNTKTLENSEP
jgi:hypothetical protein